MWGIVLGICSIGVVLVAVSGDRKDAPRHQDGGQSPREVALAVLSALPEEVRGIRDAIPRLELMVRIAEVLGRENPEHAKMLLVAAFDETFTCEDEAKGEEERLSTLNAVRQRIVSLAVRHDEGLAKSLLDRLDERTESSEEAPHYTQLARGLIVDRPDLAIYMARKRMRSFLSWEGLRFLLALREKEKAEADSFFLDLTAQVASQGAGDINELLILYAYVFSPSLPLELTRNGPQARFLPDYQSGAIDPQLATKFLQMVIPPLLVPERYAGGGPRWGPHGDFIFLTLILPQCHQFLPALADELEIQRGVLATRIAESERSSLESRVRQVLSPVVPQPDTVEALLEKAEKATSQKARERFLFRALDMAVRQGDVEHAVKIAERFGPEHREEVRSFVNYLVAEKALKAGDLASALDAARRPMRDSLRAYLLTVVAYHQFRAGDHEGAMRSLIEARPIVRKMGPDRVKASLLLGLSAVYGFMDEPDALLVLHEAIGAINKARDFHGEMTIGNLISVGDFWFAYELNDEVFHFDRTFSLLGARDFHGTMALVRSLASPVLRVRATIATCEGTLRR